MSAYDLIAEPLGYQFMRHALLAAALVGATCGLLGFYVVARRMAFIGDAMAHTLLPGLVTAYLLGVPLIAGALAAGLAMAFGVGRLAGRGRLHEDSAIGVLFTAMFAAGIALMQRQKTYRDLSAMLFGNLLGVTGADLLALAAVAAVVGGCLLLFHKELVLTSYDPGYAEGIGLRASGPRQLLLILLALAVVSAIQAVGVVLTSALLVTPAAAAGLLVRRTGAVMAVSVAIAVGSGTAGLYASYHLGLAAGASVVLAATAVFGLAWAWDALRSRRGAGPAPTPDGREPDGA